MPVIGAEGHTHVRRPLATRPTTEMPEILHLLPLNSGRYFAPVNGSSTAPAPAAGIKI